jgi:hypothetical protein
MKKYVLVSGGMYEAVIHSRIFGINLIPGVISGVGKGIIGTRQECEPHHSQQRLTCFQPPRLAFC